MLNIMQLFRLKKHDGLTLADSRRKLALLNAYKIDVEKYLDPAEHEKTAEMVHAMDITVSETGVSPSVAGARVRNALKKGYTCEKYIERKIYEFRTSELGKFRKCDRAMRAYRKNESAQFLDLACRRSGRTPEEINAMRKSAAELGYTPYLFYSKRLYMLEPDKIKQLEPYKKDTMEDLVTREGIKNSVSHTRDDYFRMIMDKTGWTIGKTRTEFLDARVRCGCTPAFYYENRLYERTPEEISDYITFRHEKIMGIKYHADREFDSIFRNKSKFNVRFSNFVHRRWFTSENLSFEDFEKQIEGLESIIYKPFDLAFGYGVAKFEVNSSTEQNRDVYERITSFRGGMIEECIDQHDVTASFSPMSVNTIRVVTLREKGHCHILGAVLRCGVNDVCDNYATGGLAAGVCTDTGVIETAGVSEKCVSHETHPVTGTVFRGCQIPFWDRILDTVREASLVVPEVPYVGWDVVIRKNGTIELLEGNTTPTLRALQTPYSICDGHGTAHTLKDFLSLT